MPGPNPVKIAHATMIGGLVRAFNAAREELFSQPIGDHPGDGIITIKDHGVLIQNNGLKRWFDTKGHSERATTSPTNSTQIMPPSWAPPEPEAGATGATGATGAATDGSTGATGDTGPAYFGDTGPTGATGAKDGSTGATGATGGSTGATGSTGA